jgi:hypothetical protein
VLRGDCLAASAAAVFGLQPVAQDVHRSLANVGEDGAHVQLAFLVARPGQNEFTVDGTWRRAADLALNADGRPGRPGRRGAARRMAAQPSGR